MLVVTRNGPAAPSKIKLAIFDRSLSARSRVSILVAVEHDDHELFAAEARNDVGSARRLAQLRGNGGEHNVAEEMPVRVVDLLEVVDIDHETGGLRADLSRARPAVLEFLNRMTTAVNTGEVIGRHRA